MFCTYTNKEKVAIVRNPLGSHEGCRDVYPGYWLSPITTAFQLELMTELGVRLPGTPQEAAAGKGAPLVQVCSSYHPTRVALLYSVYEAYKLREYCAGLTLLTPKKLAVLLSILRGDDWEIRYKLNKVSKNISKYRKGVREGVLIKGCFSPLDNDEETIDYVGLIKEWKDPLILSS